MRIERFGVLLDCNPLLATRVESLHRSRDVLTLETSPFLSDDPYGEVVILMRTCRLEFIFVTLWK